MNQQGSEKTMQNVNWRFWTYFLSIPILLFYSLVLTGCVSNSLGISNIFLLKIEPTSNPSVEVRIGYFGICYGVNPTRTCVSTTGLDASTIVSQLASSSALNGTRPDELGQLIQVSLTLQKKIFLPTLAAAGVLFVLGGAFIVNLKRQLKVINTSITAEKRKRKNKTYGLIFLWMSTGAAFVATVGGLQGTGALQYSTAIVEKSPLIFKSGVALQILQWFISALSVLFRLGVALIFSNSNEVVKSAGSDTSRTMPSLGMTPLSVGLPGSSPAGNMDLPPPPPPVW